MTALAENAPGRAPLAVRSSTLRPWLEQVHGAWMHDVLGVLDAARSTDAGIWARWAAVRYLESTFSARLETSRGALERLRRYLPADASARLWAAGELLELLRLQLDRTVALHQGGDEFSHGVVKFLRALGCWCREVEQALGALEWNALSPAAQQEVQRLSPEERSGAA